MLISITYLEFRLPTLPSLRRDARMAANARAVVSIRSTPVRRADFNDQTVVVTHMAPHYDSLVSFAPQHPPSRAWTLG